MREPLASDAPAASEATGPPASAKPVGAPAPATAPVRIAAAPAVASAPALAARPAPTVRAHPHRLALAEEAPVMRAEDTPAEARAATDETPPERGAEGAVAAAKPAPAETADAPLAARSRSVQVLFELAAQLEVRDPEAALRIYGELAAAPSSPAEGGWAASSLFAAARLEAERGHAAQSKELCEAYLHRFPRGPNADDARTLLARAR
jgi:hypothetical protein